MFLPQVALSLVFCFGLVQSRMGSIPIALVENVLDHTIGCPIQKNDFGICNYHNPNHTCICNLADPNTLMMPDPSWFCESGFDAKTIENFVNRIVVNRENHPYDNDLITQAKILDVLENHAGINRDKVIFLRVKCIRTNPDWIEFYFVVKRSEPEEDDSEYEDEEEEENQYHYFKQDYYHDYTSVFNQTTVDINILDVRVLNESLDFPSIITPAPRLLLSDKPEAATSAYFMALLLVVFSGTFFIFIAARCMAHLVYTSIFGQYNILLDEEKCNDYKVKVIRY